MLSTLAISGYRSLRNLVVPLGPLNIVTGANGSGKSNIYRALRLLADAAQGGVVASLSREGGLQSTLWAGPESFSKGMKNGQLPVQGGPRQDPVALRIGFSDDEFGYAIDLGLPIPERPPSAFVRDPEIKRECIWNGPVLRPSSLLVDRHNSVVRVRNDNGGWSIITEHLPLFDSMLIQLADPHRTPEVLMLREHIRSWRFYDHFRVDAEAPSRQPQVGTRTPILCHDGRDLAAALQTIREIGDGAALNAAVSDAFPGAELSVDHDDGRFSVKLSQHGLLRPLSASEFSDGTLRYLIWIAALLTPRPPRLMVLNEPETSLHADLLPALGRLINVAAKRSQVWVVSHAPRLIAALEQNSECHSIILEKKMGETAVAGLRELDVPLWHWPKR